MTAETSIFPNDVESFLHHLAAKGRKASTIKRYRYDLADFFRFLAVTKGDQQALKPSSLTPQAIDSYFFLLENERHYQLRTLKRVQTVLKSYTAFLQAVGKLPFDPFSSLDLDETIWNQLTKEELLSHAEQQRLLNALKSDAGLSKKQAAARPLLAPRNLFIITLFLHYGLRLQELSHLEMKHINQGTGDILIPEMTGNPRTITLLRPHKKQLHYYLQAIPEAVRPRKDTDPLLVAFDFQRKTFRWSYENDAPKNLTEIAIQKMIREERKRAGINRAVSARHFRNTYIVQALKNGETPEQLQKRLGLQTILTLNKYVEYVNSLASSGSEH